MKVAIIYSRYLDNNGQERHIGGIETYLYNLARLFGRMGIEPIIFQHARKGFKRTVDDIRIVGIPASGKRGPFHRIGFFRQAARHFETSKDIVVFGADRHSVRYDSDRCVSIQHGISWDLPNRCLSARGIWRGGLAGKIWRDGFAGKWYKIGLHRRAIRDYERCPNRVCVDYNFLNWYRTFLASEVTGHNWIIPNFSEIPDERVAKCARTDNSPLRILFARRFREARGTRLMGPVVDSLLRKHPSISFTFAGEGTDESWLKSRFAGEDRVIFLKYHRDETLDIHLKHHIAVVPSIASEGTSLSLAEAMACGCAVVATSVGGMTNMVIDGYNGKLCMPTAEEVERSIEEFIVDGDQRKRLGRVAYETAKSAFSREKWERSWSQVIETIAGM